MVDTKKLHAAAGARRHGLCACGRAGQQAEGTDRPARQACRLFRRQDAHHRLRAVQRPELGHPPHGGGDAIQGAFADPPPAARLELPAAGAKRKLRHIAGEPARVGDAVVRRHGGRGLSEHRHHRGLRSGIHGHPRRRPHLQDGLRADAAPARRPGRGRDGRLPRSAAHGSDRLRRHACRQEATRSSPSSRSPPIRPAFRTSRISRSPRWASTCSGRSS